jgi:hypothetical protein
MDIDVRTYLNKKYVLTAAIVKNIEKNNEQRWPGGYN